MSGLRAPARRNLQLLIVILGIAILIAGGLYVRKVIHETIEPATPGRHYIVALGDSVAAGAGLSDNGRRAGSCDVVAASFPILLGAKLHLPVQQLACSGATVRSDGPHSLLSEQYPQAKQFLSGSDVVVQAGANDIGWLQTLISCAQTTCDTPQTKSAVTGKLQTLQQDLTTLLVQIQQFHPKHLVVNTYYSLLASGDTCFARLGITPDKVSYIASVESQLNATITAAAGQAKASVVQIDFTGHTLCSPNPWIQGVSDNAPLHPTATGQQQIAKQDATAL